MSVKLHYNIFGKGYPLVIMHGLFGSSRNWQSVAKTLAENYQVITPDLRNHGMSDHADSMTYAEMAEDIQQLLDELSLEHITLMGHSMGGKVAMINALLYADKIDKLIALDIAPVDYQHKYGKIFYVMQNLLLDKIKNRNEAEEILNKQLDDVFLSRFLLQNLIRTDDRFQWRINLPAIQDNIDIIRSFPELDDDQEFDKPALFLGGENSHFIQAEHQQAILRYFPKADVDHIKNAGHMLHIEQPQSVLDRLRLFLQT